MFMIHMPRTFKIGDSASVNINGKPEQVTWRDAATLVIEPDDARRIKVNGLSGGDLQVFICADADGDDDMTIVTPRQGVSDMSKDHINIGGGMQSFDSDAPMPRPRTGRRGSSRAITPSPSGT
jgi:hypothetical protein